MKIEMDHGITSVMPFVIIPNKLFEQSLLLYPAKIKYGSLFTFWLTVYFFVPFPGNL